MPLLDAEAFHSGDAAAAGLLAAGIPSAEWAPRLFWTAHLRPRDFSEPPPASFEAHQRWLRLPMTVALDALPALTLVNDCRWVVYCPDRACLSAQVASRGDRRFFCVACLNRECGGHWRRAWWPADGELADAERVHEERAASGHLRGSPPQLRLCHWWPSDQQGQPHPLFAQLRGEGRLGQLLNLPAAAVEA